MSFILCRRMLWALAVAVSAAAIAASHGLLVSGVQQRAIIAELRKDLMEGYVDADLAKEMDRKLAERSRGIGSGRISFGPSFADDLNDDMGSIVRDAHLRVTYTVFEDFETEYEMPPSEERDRERQLRKADHFGFTSVEILAGNIGYIRLDSFDPSGFAARTLAAAMDRIAPTRALILDLRENGGGYPAMCLLMAGYFFDHPVHWADEYSRDDVDELWTDETVKGRRYLGKPVYILTSHETFSAAEEFSYQMKNLKRATIVGETTGGGANGGEDRHLSAHFLLFLPMERNVSPDTGTNWEGVGVQPDVRVPAEQALAKALELGSPAGSHSRLL